MLNGLSESQVLKSIEKNGKNVIPESEPTTFWAEFKETFSDPMIKILLGIAILMVGMVVVGKVFPSTGIEQSIYEPIGTMVAVFLVATISAKTAVSSDGKYRDLKSRTEKDKCKVIRNGKVVVLPFEEVVIGDVVLLQSGDKIPADGTLVEGNLRVDNSALNGEAEECKKSANANGVIPKEITGDTFVDQSSLFRGAIVYDGEGYMVIQAIGLNTMMGKMAEELNAEEVDTPLKVKLGKLAGQISIFGYISAAAIVVLYLVMGVVKAGNISDFFAMGWQHTLNVVLKAVDLAILIIVCAVPEGLPLMISLVLMQNTSKMLDHNVLVRKAQGIETAGSLNILFSDKTGTITKGKLEVVQVVAPDGKELKDTSVITPAIALNTQSTFDQSQKVVGGNATDQALAKFVGYDNFTKCDKEILKTQGFNSANKFSQSLYKDGDKNILVVKGAPEKILAKCSNVSTELTDVCQTLASKAMRLLAFAKKDNAEFVENEIPDGLELLGVAAIRDDVRPEARDAIKEVKRAGIQVVMITGDRLETARAIAEDAGLITSPNDAVISSAELNSMTDSEVKELMPRIRVIARALPTDKSRMVRLCQEMNLVCGMTGDGRL